MSLRHTIQQKETTMLDKILNKLKIKKINNKQMPIAIARNAVNKALNKAVLIALFGKKLESSVTIWEGASLFDGSPIKVVMSAYTKDSNNDKTGPMIQVYILPSDEKPNDVYKAKGSAVCGSCKYNGSGCYVNWSRLTPIWKASKKNKISLEIASWLCSQLRVRIGAAGDPAAVPTEVWAQLLKNADGWTGYTHAWESCDPELIKYFMASCDSKKEVYHAQNIGWNVFYVHDNDMDIKVDSIPCSADGIMKHCFSCMMCHGRRSTTQRPFVVTEILHGASNTLHAARQARDSA